MFKIIRNAHIYAPEDLGIQDILICDNKIIEINQNISFSYEHEEIDATNQYLVPGFIDQHVHIIGGGGENGFASLIREIQVKDCVQYGVTTVVGLLGTDAHVKSIAQLVAKTKALKEEGMSAYCLTGSYAIPTTTLTGEIGKDIAFIDEIIGTKVAISDHRSSAPNKHELSRIATQCRTAGLLAKKAGIVHMHTGKGKDGLKRIMEIVKETDIPITQFRPTHCANQYEDSLAFAKMGGYIDFTADEETASLLVETLKQVPLSQITLSSDANGSFPIWNDDMTIRAMGIGKMKTLYEVIRSMIIDQHIDPSVAISLITKNVADALLFTNKGQIKVGYDADLVVLDDSYQIQDVYALGKQMVKSKNFIHKSYYEYES